MTPPVEAAKTARTNAPHRPDPKPASTPGDAPIPAYLSDTYDWAYIDRRGIRFFDHPVIVNAILWGNMRRLTDVVLDELTPGSRVLQAACVYGQFSPRLAAHIGRNGRLEIIDIAPTQVENTAAKLAACPHATVSLANAGDPGPGDFDSAVSFFLLHEVPDDYKRRIMANLLDRVRPGGKLVIVDYHKTPWWHPIGWVMRPVYRLLEPFAGSLIGHEIPIWAGPRGDIVWSEKTLYFGGLYQKIVATKLA